MKRFALALLITLFGVVNIIAQAPQSFKYQAVVRSDVGMILQNQIVGI